MGRAVKPPPQFWQTLASTVSTQERQNVHSNVQIIASVESGGNGLLQFSQVGLNSSTARPWAYQAAEAAVGAFRTNCS